MTVPVLSTAFRTGASSTSSMSGPVAPELTIVSVGNVILANDSDVDSTCYDFNSYKGNPQLRQSPISFKKSGLQQFGNRHTQSIGNFLNVVQGDIAHLALYVGNEGAVQVGFKCQHFLRPVSLLAKPQVQFVATPGYIGTASFDYLSDDDGVLAWDKDQVNLLPIGSMSFIHGAANTPQYRQSA